MFVYLCLPLTWIEDLFKSSIHIFGNFLNHTGKFGKFKLLKKLPLMEMSKMLQNGSKISILFVGEILLVRLVVIQHGCFPEVSKLYGTKNNCTIQLGVIYVPVLQHRAH